MLAASIRASSTLDTGVGRIFSAGLARRADGAAQVARSLENVRVIETAPLERGLVPLATIAAIVPLFGFLGSVVSLMRALALPAVAGDVLASALVPAAVGLAIALPVTLMHNYLAARVARVVVDVTDSAQRAVDAIRAADAAGGSSA